MQTQLKLKVYCNKCGKVFIATQHSRRFCTKKCGDKHYASANKWRLEYWKAVYVTKTKTNKALMEKRRIRAKEYNKNHK